MKYVSLHHHSTYSFMDGFGLPSDHVERIAELGMEAIALTEHGNVSSHPQLEKAANKAGINPIYGLEAYTALEATSRRKFHLTLLAMNEQGYRNLMQVVTASWENYYQWPTVSGDILAEYNEGLIVLSGCSDSLLACSLLGGKTIDPNDASYERAKQQALKFKGLLGDRFYLETQMFPELERSGQINQAYESLAVDTGIRLVATADCHYPQPDDNEMQVILHAAGRGAGTVAAQEATWEYDIRLCPPQDDLLVLQRLGGTGLSRSAASAALAATGEIAARCNVVLPKAERLRYPTEPGETSLDLIWRWMRQGWGYRVRQGNKRMVDPIERPRYTARLKAEMEQIQAKDFVDYFLMLSDIVRHAKDKGIPVGPARGSAAASLVSYLLRITEIDPLEYPLMMFERFIDPTRTDLPDVDLDFDDDRRGEVRDYAVERYGDDRVGNVANYTKYRGRNSIDDVARVFRVPKVDAEILKGMIIERSGGDSRADQALGDTIEMFEQAKHVVDRHPDLRKATRLEGNYRGMSVHAAGLVIANTPIPDICALYSKTYKGKAGLPDRTIHVVSVDKYDAEYLGLMKADFLGLSTMGMIRIALELAGLTLEDLYRIPMDDPKTLQAFKDNDVIGIFQYEGRATRLVNKEVAPDNFAEIVDINALSRPGPLFSGTTTEYIDIKHGKRKATNYHPIIDELTTSTRGQIIYQEQILLGLARFGGLAVGRVHEIRRIISKKLGEAQFNTHSEDFINNAMQLHGVGHDTAKGVWGRLVTSASYAFNIAHAVSYSMLGFWCMWLKVHHPEAFYTAQLRKTEEDKWARLIRDAEKHGVKVRGVTPGLSGRTWAIAGRQDASYGTGVVAGWEQLKGVGEVTAQRIVDYESTLIAATGEGFQNAEDLTLVKGIGPATLAKFKEQITSDDPFGLKLTKRMLDAVRRDVRSGVIPLRTPTHISDALYGLKEKARVCWLGIVKAINYQDYIENQRSRYGLEIEEILKNMKDKHLVTSCVLRCVDDGEEDVYIRINRYQYPKYKRVLEHLRVDKDVIWVAGRRSGGAAFGINVSLDRMVVIDPEVE